MKDEIKALQDCIKMYEELIAELEWDSVERNKADIENAKHNIQVLNNSILKLRGKEK